MIKLNDILTNGFNIDGKSKQNAINSIYGKVNYILNGIFDDQSWIPVHSIFKKFDTLNLNWWLEKSNYFHDKTTGNPAGKRWYFTIEFTNKNGKTQQIDGVITASGAGSVKDPLDKYDLTMVLS